MVASGNNNIYKKKKKYNTYDIIVYTVGHSSTYEYIIYYYIYVWNICLCMR